MAAYRGLPSLIQTFTRSVGALGVAIALATSISSHPGLASGNKDAKDAEKAVSAPARLEDVKIAHAWARAAGADSSTHVFFSIENTGDGGFRVHGARTPVAENALPVRFGMRGGVLRPALIDPIPIGPRDRFALEPGVVALELRDLRQPLRPGQTIRITLDLGETGLLEIPVLVEPRHAIAHRDESKNAGISRGSAGSGARPAQ